MEAYRFTPELLDVEPLCCEPVVRFITQGAEASDLFNRRLDHVAPEVVPEALGSPL